jgi:hypothetical protein
VGDDFDIPVISVNVVVSDDISSRRRGGEDTLSSSSSSREFTAFTEVTGYTTSPGACSAPTAR